jgi:predicted DCC family thiol-disulfide oxidoreductase YuxK
MEVHTQGLAMTFTQPYQIFLDGSCSFCRWTRKQIEPYDSNSRLRFLDFNDPSVAAQTTLTPSDLRSEMNVRTPEGAWLRGFDAWVAILRVLPKFAWLARIAGLPPLRWAGPSIYRFVARHRHAIPGAPETCTAEVCVAPNSRQHGS